MSNDSSSPIRPDIEKLLREAYPQGVMAPAFDIQKSHLADVFPRLKTRLLDLDGAAVGYERDPLGGGGWRAGDGRLPSGPADDERSDHPSSYYLLFLTATAESCRVDVEDTLKIGYSVALSVMAPVAIVVLNHMEEDDFSHTVPEIAPELVDVDDDSVEIDRYCQDVLSAEGLATLERLRESIIAELEAFGFRLLPEEEQGKPIPWLEVPAMPFANPPRLTVRDAIFFWAM